MSALVFNAGVLLGLLITFAGTWRLFGFWAALLVLGCMVWSSTLLAAHIVAGRGRSG